MKNTYSIIVRLFTLLIFLFLTTNLSYGESINPAPLWARGGHNYVVYSVAISPDGNTIASAGADNLIKLWDAATGNLRATFVGHTDIIYSVAFSSDGKTIASASEDRTIKLWNTVTGKLINTLTGHSKPVSSVVFSPDGKTIASASADESIRLWDVATGKLVNSLTTPSPETFSQ